MTKLIKSHKLEGWIQCKRYGEYSPSQCGNKELFMCRNAKCKQLMCRKCGGEAHIGSDCPITAKEQAFINHVAKAMDEARTTKCPYCELRCSKISACNHICCPKCKGYFCYLCGCPLARPNEQLCSNHFGVGRCPLQCNTSKEEQQRLDEERAKRAGKKAADVYRMKNPESRYFKFPAEFGII